MTEENFSKYNDWITRNKCMFSRNNCNVDLLTKYSLNNTSFK